MLHTNTNRQVKKYNDRLEKMSKYGIRDTAANTLDRLAFESKKYSTKNFERDHIIRSNWMQRGLLFQKTKRGIPIKYMEARQGSIRAAGKILEMGGAIKPNEEYISIPTKSARIGNSIKKKVAKKFRVSQMRNARRLPSTSGSVERKFAAMLNIARKDKFFGPFVIEEKEAGSANIPVGIFNLTGRGRGRPGGGKITMIRSLKKKAEIKPQPYLQPAAYRSGNNMDKIYVRQAKRMLRRYGRSIK